jgi:hypothetical protein
MRKNSESKIVATTLATFSQSDDGYCCKYFKSPICHNISSVKQDTLLYADNLEFVTHSSGFEGIMYFMKLYKTV